MAPVSSAEVTVIEGNCQMTGSGHFAWLLPTTPVAPSSTMSLALERLKAQHSCQGIRSHLTGLASPLNVM